MKKTFLMFGVVAGIYATNVFATQTSTVGTKPVQAEDGYLIAFKCPEDCIPYTTGSQSGSTGTLTVHCKYRDGTDCGAPKKVVSMEEYSVKVQQTTGVAKNVELSKDVGFKGTLEVPASKLDRQPEKSHIKPRSAVRVPTKIIYKEITFDDDIEEIEDFGM